MNVSDISSASSSLYLQFITGNSKAKTLLASDSDSNAQSLVARVDTTYIDKAMAGERLNLDEQQVMRREFHNLVIARLLSISV